MASLAEIRARIAAQENKSNAGSTQQSDNSIYPHWNMDEGTIATVRFLPDANSSNTFFWVERQIIKLPFNGVKGDPNVKQVKEALSSMEMVIVQDLFINETAQFAHVFLPGTSFLEKDGTFTNAERRINRVRPVMASKTGKSEWEATCDLSKAMGYEMKYENAAQIMDEIAKLTPTFAGVSFKLLDEVGSVQWPCNEKAPLGTPIMHIDQFVRGKGNFVETPYVPTEEKTNRKFPLLLTTGRILSQYNVGAQTRRTANVAWYPEDVLEIHEADAQARGIAPRCRWCPGDAHRARRGSRAR